MAEKFEYTREWTNAEAFPLLGFTKSWENPEDYPTIELDETQVRKDMQSLHDEVKNYINDKLIPAVLAEDATEAARAAAEAVREANEAQRIENENARIAAEQARVDETNGIVAQAAAQAKAAAESAAQAKQIAIGDIPDGTLPESKLVEEARAAIDRAKVGGEIDVILNAAEYSAAQTYAVGDYCTHDGKLYRCTTAITGAEEWTAAHWTETSVATELEAISTTLQKKADTTKKTTVTLSTNWTGNTSPYTQSVTISGTTSNSKVDLQPDATAIAQMAEDGTVALYIANNNGVLTANAVGEKPTAEMTIQATITEVI